MRRRISPTGEELVARQEVCHSRLWMPLIPHPRYAVIREALEKKLVTSLLMVEATGEPLVVSLIGLLAVESGVIVLLAAPSEAVIRQVN